MAGAEALAEWAQRLRGLSGMPEAVRPTVEAWCAAGAERGPASETERRETPPAPEDRKAALRIEAFLVDCEDLLFEAGIGRADLPVGAAEPDPWAAQAGMLRRQGLGMLGDGPGARLDDPARIRLARVETDRARVREAVDKLAEATLQRRSERFMALARMVSRQRRESGSDPVDLPSWAALRERAEDLRGEASLAPGTERTVRRVLDRDARAKAETRPVEAFLEAGGAHLRRREVLEETARERGTAPFTFEDMTAWWDGCGEIRDTGRRLLGGAGADAAEARAAARLADMPRLQGRVRQVLGRLEAAQARDRGDVFEALADRVEELAVEQDTLALYVDEYDHATALAEELESLEALPEAARQRVESWLARDREWREELASIARLTGAQGQQADPAARREAAGRPAVAEAIRRETGRLARLPEPERTIRWTGEEPLVPGDRLRIGAGDGMMETVVVSTGETGGMRPDDDLELQILFPTGPDSPPDKGPIVPFNARYMVRSGCARAAWSDEGLRELELARQQSVPSGLCRFALSRTGPWRPHRLDRGCRVRRPGPHGRGTGNRPRRRHPLRQRQAGTGGPRRLRSRGPRGGQPHREDGHRRHGARLLPCRMDR